MNPQRPRLIFCAGVALVISTIGFGSTPTPQQALDYAKSVVLVKWVVQGDQIHSYVEEVWRFASDGETPPAVGSEYGRSMHYNSRIPPLERDVIFFNFGAVRPKGLPNRWRVPVSRQGMVPDFSKSVFYDQMMGSYDKVMKGESAMSVDEVRRAVEKTKPRA